MLFGLGTMLTVQECKNYPNRASLPRGLTFWNSSKYWMDLRLDLQNFSNLLEYRKVETLFKLKTKTDRN